MDYHNYTVVKNMGGGGGEEEGGLEIVPNVVRLRVMRAQ